MIQKTKKSKETQDGPPTKKIKTEKPSKVKKVAKTLKDGPAAKNNKTEKASKTIKKEVVKPKLNNTNVKNGFSKTTKSKVKVEPSNKKTKKLTVKNEDESETTSSNSKTGKKVMNSSSFLKTTKSKTTKPGAFVKGKKTNVQTLVKPEDWSKFKKEKKALRLKRRQSKPGFDVIDKVKQIGEKLRRKALKGGEEERNKLVNQAHSLLKGKEHYPKFVLAHDTARIVQYILKYGSNIVRDEVSKEIICVTVEMLQSKYGKYCVKRLLKHGSPEIRSLVINAMYGHSVKLASHSISSPILEYAYSTWATPLQKLHLTQEFFSDLYKNNKDDNVKHLHDVYSSSPELKNAILTAVKENLQRILNKELLDSGLVQTVLCQYLSECKDEDRAELITQLASHIVVISNSKDGSRAAMKIIWHGTNKDKKVAMKALKEHVVELSKHEYGHCTIIALMDSIDDTVLLHKIILGEILNHARDLASDEWGRKVLLWLVAPAESAYFHPVFIKELETGRIASNSKKPVETRRKELLQYANKPLLDLVKSDPEFWLSKSSLALEMLAILKAGSGKELEETFTSVVNIVVNPEWKIKEDDKEILGIEAPGLHMILKKIAQHDKINAENNIPTFGACLVENLSVDVVKQWVKLNRGCFLLVVVFENGTEDVQAKLKQVLQKCVKLLKNESSAGAKILLKKII